MVFTGTAVPVPAKCLWALANPWLPPNPQTLNHFNLGGNRLRKCNQHNDTSDISMWGGVADSVGVCWHEKNNLEKGGQSVTHHIEIPLGGHGSGRRKDVDRRGQDRLWLSCGRRGQSPDTNNRNTVSLPPQPGTAAAPHIPADPATRHFPAANTSPTQRYHPITRTRVEPKRLTANKWSHLYK